MPVVLPGEVIHTQHKTLKLGPGLQQSIDFQGKTSTVVTRAGTLEQNAKGNNFWVEGNSRRVSLTATRLSVDSIVLCLSEVCAGSARACRWHRECSTG